MFVTFEGLDGSGKSTQAELLRARLEADGVDVVSTREPGGTELGERVRDLVLHGGHVARGRRRSSTSAARAQLVDEVIRPALERGASVICDRYVDSSVAYQGVGRELGLERVLDLNLAAVGGLLPDRTFLLELDPSEVPARIAAALRSARTRIGDDFRARAAAGYRELAERFPERIVVLDATPPGRRARRGGVWSPSRPYLSSPRRSGS